MALFFGRRSTPRSEFAAIATEFLEGKFSDYFCIEECYGMTPSGVRYADFVVEGEDVCICFEIKSKYQDLHSGSGLNFFADLNYLVIPKDLLNVSLTKLLKIGRLDDVGIITLDLSEGTYKVEKEAKWYRGNDIIWTKNAFYTRLLGNVAFENSERTVFDLLGDGEKYIKKMQTISELGYRYCITKSTMLDEDEFMRFYYNGFRTYGIIPKKIDEFDLRKARYEAVSARRYID